MLNAKLKYSLLAAVFMIGGSAGTAQASYCGDGKTVTFAGIDWESGAFITEVMKEILAKGYDCKVDSIPGNSVTLEQATANNDVQIFAENGSAAPTSGTRPLPPARSRRSARPSSAPRKAGSCRNIW